MEKYQRYLFLKSTVDELDKDPRMRTYGWFIVHNQFLEDCYEHFEDFEKVNPEMDSNWFRSQCRELNILLDRLLREYMTSQWFGLYDYHQFCKILLSIVEYSFSSDDTSDELSDLITNRLSLAGETNK
jgi:hypothetical protein